MPAFDPVAFLGGFVVVVLACGGAALIPAMTALQVDAMEALRQE